jgi:predicted phosphodiesterase
MTNKKSIILIGDIHGNFSELIHDIKRYKHGNSYLIQVGDFGIGFHSPNYYKEILTKLNNILVSTDNHLFVIRGNHDSPEFFKTTNNPFNLSNITLLEDYSELELLGKKFLFVGGAISIDRVQRVEGRSWWADENFVLRDEESFPYENSQYDIVVAHTRPGVAGTFKGFGNIAGWFDNDITLKDELIKESEDMDKLWELTKPCEFYYGHFHQSQVSEYQGTTFRCLDIDEHYMIPS